MDKKAKKRSLGLSKTEKRIIICTAAVVLIALSIYPTVTYLVPFIKYSHAVSLMEKGSFDEATAAFEEMGDYKDAPEKIGECAELKKQARLEAAYQDAVALMENKEYDKAISAFRAIEDYKDAKDKISECVKLREQVRLETDYQEGLNLKASGSYDKAISKLESVHGYKDSEDQIKEIKFMQAQGFLTKRATRQLPTFSKDLGTTQTQRRCGKSLFINRLYSWQMFITLKKHILYLPAISPIPIQFIHFWSPLKAIKRQMIGWTSSSFYKRLRPMKMKKSILLILARLRNSSPILTELTITNIKMKTARLQVGLQLTVENPNYPMKTVRLFTKG